MTKTLQPRTQILPAQAGTLAEHPATVYLSGLSKRSRVTQKHYIDVIAGILTNGQVNNCLDLPPKAWGAVRYAHAAAIRSQLKERYKRDAANSALSAFRGLLTAARLLGLLSVDEWHAMTAPKIGALKQVRGETIPAGRELSSGELLALFSACQADPGPAGVRDSAMLALLYSAGLRRAEIVGLDLGDYDPQGGRLVIAGKGNKQRTAYITGGAAAALADWLELRGTESGPLFLRICKGGGMVAERLSPQAVYYMLRKRGQSAGVSHFSPHDLRRSFVSDLLEAGADIATVSKMAGHANMQTTLRYDKRPEQAKEKAAGLLFVPYQPRKERGG